MEWIMIAIVGILGMIIGSFLGVVILRINTGRGLGGRSQCLSCDRQLTWQELIPVVSFLRQKGKCRTCRSKIPLQDFIVEIVTGVIFAVTAYYVSGIALILWLVVVSLGIVISVYDIRHRMIPIVPLILLACFGALLGFHLLGVLIALPFLAMWFISSGKWMGLGDIELMAVMGLVLGFSSGISAVILAFWIACAVMLPIVYWYRHAGKKRNPEIPFGPFLLAGLYLVGVCGLDIVNAFLKMIY
jgi:prepilin signal peptidase PulO-like enzyme (type II secretory pathway)